MEDEPAVRGTLVRILEREGYEVTPAEDGEQALELFRSDGPFDIVLSDIQMPGALQGDDLARTITAISDTPVVLMSGNPGFRPRVAGVSYLKKPFDVVKLNATFAETLSPPVAPPEPS